MTRTLALAAFLFAAVASSAVPPARAAQQSPETKREHGTEIQLLRQILAKLNTMDQHETEQTNKIQDLKKQHEPH